MIKPLLLLAAMVLGTAVSSADGAYPERAITLVVTSAPGGITDALGRALAPRLAKALSGNVIVENRGGGRNVIGTLAVARAPADGLTLLITDDSTLTLNPILISKLPYSVPGSFTPIALLVNNPQSLVVGPSVQAADVAAFIATAKARPGSMSFATPGLGTAAQMHFVNLQQLAAIQLQDVTYKGAGPALNDVLGGQVDSMIVSAGLIAPFVKSGKLRALAQAGPTRTPLLPGVPTFAESGLPSFSPRSWFALLAPAGVPAGIASRLNEAVNAIIADPAFKDQVLDRLALEPLGGPAERLWATVEADSQRWAALVRAGKIKTE